MSSRSLWQFSVLRLIPFFLVAISFGAVYGTDRPVVGILTQELGSILEKHFDPKVYTSYIAASYVKYFESSGARVVPIPINRTLEYYRELVHQLNGVVFPGGHARVDQQGYGKSGKLLLTALEESAKNGTPVPALGVCLGMDLMAWHDYEKLSNEIDDSHRRLDEWGPLVECKIRDINLPLQYKSNPRNSSIFKQATETDIDLLKTRSITVNNHNWCITESSMERTKIRSLWKVVATSQNKTGLEFVSVMQSGDRHFYAVQFHPEKNAFEWSPKKNYVHELDAVRTLRVFGDSFVDLCRENDNIFPVQREIEQVIYKYSPVYSGRRGVAYEQLYLFRRNDLN